MKLKETFPRAFACGWIVCSGSQPATRYGVTPAKSSPARVTCGSHLMPSVKRPGPSLCSIEGQPRFFCGSARFPLGVTRNRDTPSAMPAAPWLTSAKPFRSANNPDGTPDDIASPHAGYGLPSAVVAQVTVGRAAEPDKDDSVWTEVRRRLEAYDGVASGIEDDELVHGNCDGPDL